MKNLKQLLENKFLVKKNITKDDKQYKVYKNRTDYSYWVKIATIDEYDSLTNFYKDNSEIAKTKEKIEYRITAEEKENNKVAIFISPKIPFSKKEINWTWTYEKDIKVDFSIVKKISAENFTVDYWEKQHWTGK